MMMMMMMMIHRMSAFMFLLPVSICYLLKDSYSRKFNYLRRKSTTWLVNCVLSAAEDIDFRSEPKKLWGRSKGESILGHSCHHLVLLEAAHYLPLMSLPWIAPERLSSTRFLNYIHWTLAVYLPVWSCLAQEFRAWESYCSRRSSNT